MAILKDVVDLLAMGVMTAGMLMADSPLATGMRYVGLIYLVVDLLLRVRSGYLRRRPHWTRGSWGRYLIACSVPVGTLLVMAGMLVALALGVGQARATRGAMVLVLFISMFVGAIGLAVVLRWLTDGEASRQFTGPGWFRRRGDEAA